MKVYIASSWRNAHGVELLTKELRSIGCEVLSWIENNYGETHNHVTKQMDFETWVASPDSDLSFIFDTRGATECELFIYYAPAGMDACAELGAAWFAGRSNPFTKRKNIWGLWAKGEGLGLMRKMVHRWFDRPDILIANVKSLMEFRQ